MAHTYSTKAVTNKLLEELKQALQSVKDYGSVEVFIQDGIVTQITVRKIKKTAKSKSTGS